MGSLVGALQRAGSGARSFEAAHAAITRRCGPVIGKRQVEVVNWALAALALTREPARQVYGHLDRSGAAQDPVPRPGAGNRHPQGY
jgi:hypothetical protein